MAEFRVWLLHLTAPTLGLSCEPRQSQSFLDPSSRSSCQRKLLERSARVRTARPGEKERGGVREVPGGPCMSQDVRLGLGHPGPCVFGLSGCAPGGASALSRCCQRYRVRNQFTGGPPRFTSPTSHHMGRQCRTSRETAFAHRGT